MKVTGLNFDPSLLQNPFAPLYIEPKAKGVQKQILKKQGDENKVKSKVEQRVKKEAKCEVKEEHQEEEVGRGNPTGKGRSAAGKASKAASCRTWKQAKRATKREGVMEKEISKKSLLLQEQYCPLPPPFQGLALLLCRASLKATLYKDFITTKTKGNAWKHQWGDAHGLFLTTFKQELAKHETEVSRCEVKIGALWKAWKAVKGPQLDPQGAVQEGSSALVEEWERVAPEDMRETMKAIQVMEAEVAKEVEDMAIASKELLSLE